MTVLPQNWMREIGTTGIVTSAVIAGGSPLGTMLGIYGYEVSSNDAVDFVGNLLSSPIRAIDTSNNYSDGESERRIGAAIAASGGMPPDFSVFTKVDARDGDFSGDRVRASLDESLDRLGLDTVPLLFLHDPDQHSFDLLTEPGGAVETLVALKAEGRVAHIGLASGQVHEASRYLELGVFEVVLNHSRYTLVDRSAGALFDQATAAGIGVINAAIYGGGILANPHGSTTYGYSAASRTVLQAVRAMDAVCARNGTDLATAALQFSLKDPRISATVVGFTKAARIDKLITAATTNLPEQVWEELNALVPSEEHWLDFDAVR